MMRGNHNVSRQLEEMIMFIFGSDTVEIEKIARLRNKMVMEK